MSRPRHDDDDEAEDDLADPQGPGAADADLEGDDSVDGDDDTVPCPYCHRAIYEAAEYCPHCGRYVSAEDAPASRKPLWIVIGVIVTLIVILLCWTL